MAPVVLNMILCRDVRPDPRNLQDVNAYGLVMTLRPRRGKTFPVVHPLLSVLIVFKGGDGIGEFKIRIVDEKTGQTQSESKTPHRVRFLGDPEEISGAVVRMRNCTFRRPAVYWVELLFAGKVIARQSIRVTS